MGLQNCDKKLGGGIPRDQEELITRKHPQLSTICSARERARADHLGERESPYLMLYLY